MAGVVSGPRKIWRVGAARAVAGPAAQPRLMGGTAPGFVNEYFEIQSMIFKAEKPNHRDLHDRPQPPQISYGEHQAIEVTPCWLNSSDKHIAEGISIGHSFFFGIIVSEGAGTASHYRKGFSHRGKGRFEQEKK
uniref:Uncharacterized protein n=1 Tax=Oryza nivara TaxID=4536 RepID=A0A0E0IQI8_ORYNI